MCIRDSSNTVVTIDERLFLKGYRRLRPGIQPELEIGRFLTEVAKFKHCVPVAGAVEYEAEDGTTLTLAMLQAYVSNQGDGWAYTVGYLERYLEDRRTTHDEPPPDVHGAYLALVQVLGTRTAELHLAFSRPSGNPAFEPEPLTGTDVIADREQASADLDAAMRLLEARIADLPATVRDEARAVLATRDRLLGRLAACADAPGKALKTRLHGDYHLGQVLLQNNDFLIIDFEGEPARSFEERRAKRSPLRDVAGMLRSFDYARWSALRRVAQEPSDVDRLAPLALRWRDEVQAAFLHAYDEAARGSGLYASIAPGRGLLGLYEIEKVLYELRYELANRPDWVQIPLRGLLEAAEPR